MCRLLFLLLALICCAPAVAEDYYWYNNVDSVKYPSPKAACQAVVDNSEANAAKTYSFHATRLTATLIDPAQNAARCDIHSAYQQNESLWVAQVADYPNSWSYTSRIVFRKGSGCSGGEYNTEVGQCQPPTDEQCKARDSYTKAVQFVYSDGGAVLDLDAEVKDHCIYEPGEPENCNDNVCTVPMTPVGNDNFTDNAEPSSSLQDYLDELAKQFECTKTANGSVGCTAAQTNPPDIDPDNKCPEGYSWSGSTCTKTGGGGNENPDTPGGGTGGGNNEGSGEGGGNNPGTGGGEGGDDSGGSQGGGGGNDGTNGGKGPKESLEQPKQGSWEESLTTWTAKVEEAKKEFSEKIKENADQLKGVFDLNLGEGGGKLPCDTFVVWKKSVSLCFTPYEEKLSYLRYALMFMASVLAAFVILKE